MFVRQENKIVHQQSQELLINLAMRQAFHVMQLPVLELAEWLEGEIESNPVLEWEPSQAYSGLSSSRSEEKAQMESKESRVPNPVSLYEYLMQQVPLHFERGRERAIAERLIGQVNEKGFLEDPLEAVGPDVCLAEVSRILKKVQQLDPPGIGARDVREALLLQLEGLGKRNSLAFLVVERHFDALLHNRLPAIAKHLQVSVSSVQKALKQELVPLDLYPGYRFGMVAPGPLTPDVLVQDVGGQWHIEVNTDPLPAFRPHPYYERAPFAPRSEEANYVRQKLVAGRWLKRALEKRNQTLQRITALILKRQSAFFEGRDRGALRVLTSKQISRELGLHESTVARAIAHKYLACPQGLFPLRHFCRPGTVSSAGESISNQSLKELLLKAIEWENKQRPLSDAQLSSELRRQGFSCARRTISKYRAALRIAPASQRRRWK